MSNVTIYTSDLCGFCWRAKHLLTEKNVAFDEISVDGKADIRQAMTKRAGGVRSVPQIFIDDVHVGGCDDLYNLERQGKLDALLSL